MIQSTVQPASCDADVTTKSHETLYTIVWTSERQCCYQQHCPHDANATTKGCVTSLKNSLKLRYAMVPSKVLTPSCNADASTKKSCDISNNNLNLIKAMKLSKALSESCDTDASSIGHVLLLNNHLKLRNWCYWWHHQHQVILIAAPKVM